MAFDQKEQEIIKFGLENGKSKEEVQSAIARYRTGAPTASPQFTLGTKSPSYLDRVLDNTAADINKRVTRFDEIKARNTNVLEKGVQMFGQGAGMAAQTLETLVGEVPGVKQTLAAAGTGIHWLATSELSPIKHIGDAIGESQALQDVVHLYDTDKNFKDTIDGVANIARLGGDVAAAVESANYITSVTNKVAANVKTRAASSANALKETKASIATSGHDYDAAIKAGDVTRERVFRPDGALQPDIAQHVVSDIAGKIDMHFKKGLGEQFKSSVDMAKPTIESLQQQAATFLEQQGGGPAGLAATAGRFVSKAAQATSNVKTMKETIARALYGKDYSKLTESLKADYDKIPLPKAVVQQEAETGKSFAQFMAEKPYLSLSVKESKWDTFTTAQKLREEVSSEAQALNNLLEGRIETLSEQEMITQMKNSIKAVAAGQERAAVERFIENEVPTLVDQFATKIIETPQGRAMSISDWNKVKSLLWDRSPFKATASRSDNLKSSIDYKMGQVIRRNIEETVDDADVQLLNSQIGDYYHSIAILENLHGGAAPGGRIGNSFTKLAGAVAGSPGGIIGSIAGYLAADKIAEIMMNPALTTALKREALMQLKTERPTVAQQVAEILKKQGNEQADRLLLPEGAIPLGPQQRASTVEAFQAPKGIPGRTPKGLTGGGRFFKTFGSGTE